MLDFYRGKRVLVTGHTGFKGTWMCKLLVNSGAEHDESIKQKININAIVFFT